MNGALFNTAQNMKFSITNSSVNVTKSARNCEFGHFPEEFLNGKLHSLCSAPFKLPSSMFA